MKFTPNALTVARIIGSVFLLWVKPLSAEFILIYLFCGITDGLDGFIARRFQLASPFGATLDSVADCCFILITLIRVIPIMHLPLWGLFWLGGISLIKGSTLFIGLMKYRALAFLHTYLNKVTGGVLFAFPILYLPLGMKLSIVLLCLVASIAAIEELAINIVQKDLKRDQKGFFFK
ncbi:CDP-alcohol phosphatidyltransferase family protein [Anaerotignum sp.]|uniref:CDP-alcohol phosphatidyltransferase family protein n=1 Tax=Anaerotignum sp. TaxID=2039241 RepID=UPI00331E0AC7